MLDKGGSYMVHVGITGVLSDRTRILEWAHALPQDRLWFEPHTEDSDVHIEIVSDRGSELFMLAPDKGVHVSDWQSQGICLYSGIEPEVYLLLYSMLGLIQWWALEPNPHLIPEDFFHPAGPNSLLARQEYKQDYALILESPSVCSGCLEFYRCLGAELEVHALQCVIDFITMCRRTPR